MPSAFGTWLFRIVTNAALMHRRARARRPVESLEAFARIRRDRPPLPHANGAAGDEHADELLDQLVMAEEATAALDRLPDLYRSAFVLRDLEELTTSEVADALGVEPATVREQRVMASYG